MELCSKVEKRPKGGSGHMERAPNSQHFMCMILKDRGKLLHIHIVKHL